MNDLERDVQRVLDNVRLSEMQQAESGTLRILADLRRKEAVLVDSCCNAAQGTIEVRRARLEMVRALIDEWFGAE